MSLQSDLELCLGYAQKLEELQEQRVQGQNNIVYLQSESERLKNKKSKCLWVCILSVVIPQLLVLVIMLDNPIAGSDDGKKRSIIFLLCSIVVCIPFAVIWLKTRKKLAEHEARKPGLLQQYTAEIEACEREIADLIDEIYDEELTEIVPEEYFSVAAIEFCLSQVHKKLANTATEVFRQLDAEIKRLEHMEHLEQMNDARLEQLSEIKRAIDVNTMVNVAEQIRRDS